MARKTSVERLVEKLRGLGYRIPEKWTFERLRPGHWGRSAGAWSWHIQWESYTDPGVVGLIGSADSVQTLLRAEGIEYGPWGEISAA